MNMFKKNGGFTLVELIVVIAILAILAGVAVPAYSGYINSANETADITALGAVKTAAQAAFAKQGAVTKIVVEDGETDSIQVWLDGATDDDDAKDPVTDGENFLTYLNATSFSIELKTGDTAEWDGAKWEISDSEG